MFLYVTKISWTKVCLSRSQRSCFIWYCGSSFPRMAEGCDDTNLATLPVISLAEALHPFQFKPGAETPSRSVSNFSPGTPGDETKSIQCWILNKFYVSCCGCNGVFKVLALRFGVKASFVAFSSSGLSITGAPRRWVYTAESAIKPAAFTKHVNMLKPNSIFNAHSNYNGYKTHSLKMNVLKSVCFNC